MFLHGGVFNLVFVCVCKKSSIELVSIFGDFELELNYCSLLVPNSERERGSALVIEHAPNLELACMSGCPRMLLCVL